MYTRKGVKPTCSNLCGPTRSQNPADAGCATSLYARLQRFGKNPNIHRTPPPGHAHSPDLFPSLVTGENHIAGDCELITAAKATSTTL